MGSTTIDSLTHYNININYLFFRNGKRTKRKKGNVWFLRAC